MDLCYFRLPVLVLICSRISRIEAVSSKILSVQEQDKWRRRGSSANAGSSTTNSNAPSTPEFRGAIDRTLVGVVLSLCGFGLMAVYSASAPEAQQSFQDSTALLRKQ